MRGAGVSEFLKKTKGSMTVEFVLLVPMLLAALGFAYEFGRGFWAYDVMSRDVRAAVRYLSRAYPYDNTNKGYAINLAKTGVPTGGTNHFPWGAPWSSAANNCASCVSVDWVPAPSFTMANFNQTGNLATCAMSCIFSVTGTVPLTIYFLTPLQRLGINTSYTLRVTDQARYIGN